MIRHFRTLTHAAMGSTLLRVVDLSELSLDFSALLPCRFVLYFLLYERVRMLIVNLYVLKRLVIVLLIIILNVWSYNCIVVHNESGPTGLVCIAGARPDTRQE